MAKWRDRAWKEILCHSGQSAIEYLMPDLAADMDPTGKINSTSGEELFSEGSVSDKYMRVPDAFFNIPMLHGESENVAFFAEQQHEPSADLPRKVFDVFVRVLEKRRQPTTCIVIYTGKDSSNVNTYVESCYGFKVTAEFRTYYLPEKDADELGADSRPFARIMQASRLALAAGDSIKLREKYAVEIVEATAKQGYDDKNKFFILNFAKKIFQVSAPEISESVKEVFDVQMIPLEEYAQKVSLENAREEGGEEKALKIARSMLADGKPLHEVAKYTELPVEDLQDLMAVSPTS
jgi:hypothetical protein